MLNDMAIACSCYGLRDADIVEVIRDGACTVDDVTDACLAGGRCGCCHATIETLLRINVRGEPAAVA